MFNWVTETVTTAASQTAQLAQAALDSVVGDEEDEQELTAAQKMMFDIDDRDVSKAAPQKKRSKSPEEKGEEDAPRTIAPAARKTSPAGAAKKKGGFGGALQTVGLVSHERKNSDEVQSDDTNEVAPAATKEVEEVQRVASPVENHDDCEWPEPSPAPAVTMEARTHTKPVKKKGLGLAKKVSSTSTGEHKKATLPPPPAQEKQPDEDDEWAPKELRFATEQPKHIFNFGMSLLDKGAGLVNSVLPDLEEESATAGTAEAASAQDQPTATESASQEKATTAPSQDRAAVKDNSAKECKQKKVEEKPRTTSIVAQLAQKLAENGDAVQLLRAASGAAELKRRNATPPLPRETYLDTIVDPCALADFEPPADAVETALAMDDECALRVQWVANTSIGTKLTSLVHEMIQNGIKDNNTGAALSEMALFEGMSDFPELAQTTAEKVAQLLAHEIYEGLLGKNTEWLFRSRGAEGVETCTDIGCDGMELLEPPAGLIAEFMNDQDSQADEAAVKNNVASALNLIDVVHFGLWQISIGSNQLCDMAQECVIWSKRVDHEQSKAIKDRSLSVRGDCYVAGAGAAAVLEEVLECVVPLFPSSCEKAPEAIAVVETAVEPKTQIEDIDQVDEEKKVVEQSGKVDDEVAATDIVPTSEKHQDPMRNVEDEAVSNDANEGEPSAAATEQKVDVHPANVEQEDTVAAPEPTEAADVAAVAPEEQTPSKKKPGRKGRGMKGAKKGD